MSRQLNIRLNDQDEVLLSQAKEKYNLTSDSDVIRKGLECLSQPPSITIDEDFYNRLKQEQEEREATQQTTINATPQNIDYSELALCFHCQHLFQAPNTTPRYVWYAGQRRLEYW